MPGCSWDFGGLYGDSLFLSILFAPRKLLVALPLANQITEQSCCLGKNRAMVLFSVSACYLRSATARCAGLVEIVEATTIESLSG